MSLLSDLFNPINIAVFVFLGLLSLTAIATGFFKYMQFWRLGVGQRRQADTILDQWLSGQALEAMEAAARGDSVLARILQSVFSGIQARPEDRSYAEELGRQTAIVELAAMNERMRLLEMVVQAAPMLGLLGTVIGMIDAFTVLSLSEGAPDPAELANGIWTALTTTAVGLSIALITYFVATYFENRIDRERAVMEALISAAVHGRVDPTARG